MSLTSHAVFVLILAGGVGCTRSDQPAAAAVSTRSARPAAAPQPPPELVSGFLGCYELSVEGGQVYRIRLTDTNIGPSWAASSYGPGSRNAPGDQWSWTPTDSTRFTLEWGGIDSAMEFIVERRASHYTASGHLQQSPGRRGSTDLHPTVRRIECPSPAA